jgi:hypothetical protein
MDFATFHEMRIWFAFYYRIINKKNTFDSSFRPIFSMKTNRLAKFYGPNFEKMRLIPKFSFFISDFAFLLLKIDKNCTFWLECLACMANFCLFSRFGTDRQFSQVYPIIGKAFSVVQISKKCFLLLKNSFYWRFYMDFATFHEMRIWFAFYYRIINKKLHFRQCIQVYFANFGTNHSKASKSVVQFSKKMRFYTDKSIQKIAFVNEKCVFSIKNRENKSDIQD